MANGICITCQFMTQLKKKCSDALTVNGEILQNINEKLMISNNVKKNYEKKSTFVNCKKHFTSYRLKDLFYVWLILLARYMVYIGVYIYMDI